MTLYYVKRLERDKFLLVGDVVASYHGRMDMMLTQRDAYDLRNASTRYQLEHYGFRTPAAAKRCCSYSNKQGNAYWDFVDAKIVKIDFSDYDKGFQEV